VAEGFLFQDGQTVVLAGDSITDCGRMGAQFPYGDGYVRQIVELTQARYPERSIRFWNEGIGGNTVEDLRNRWFDDVIRRKPYWVSVKIGINDLHRTLGDNCLPPERFRSLYRSILDDTKRQTSARLILIDPFYISRDASPQSWRSRVLAALPGYLDVVSDMAQEFGAIHIRTHDEFQKQLEYRPADMFCGEPVHPNHAGHMVIAQAVLRAIGW
jgi:lysophospholipase L1-like esterase